MKRTTLAIALTLAAAAQGVYADTDATNISNAMTYRIALPQHGIEIQRAIAVRAKNSDLVWRHKGYAERIEMNDMSTTVSIALNNNWEAAFSDLAQHGGWGDGTPDEHKYIIGSGGMCTDGPCAPTDRYITQGWVRSAGLSRVFEFGDFRVRLGGRVNVQHWQLEANAGYEGSQFDAYASHKYTYKSTQVGHGFAASVDYNGRDAKGNGLDAHVGYVDHHSTCKFKDGEFPSEVCATLTVRLSYQLNF